MASRQEGIEAKLIAYAEKIIKEGDPKAKLSDAAKQIAKDTAKNFTETFTSLPLFPVANGTIDIVHGLGFKPSVTIQNSLDGATDIKIINITDSEIRIYNTGTVSVYPAYIYCH